MARHMRHATKGTIAQPRGQLLMRRVHPLRSPSDARLPAGGSRSRSGQWPHQPGDGVKGNNVRSRTDEAHKIINYFLLLPFASSTLFCRPQLFRRDSLVFQSSTSARPIFLVTVFSGFSACIGVPGILRTPSHRLPSASELFGPLRRLFLEVHFLGGGRLFSSPGLLRDAHPSPGSFRSGQGTRCIAGGRTSLYFPELSIFVPYVFSFCYLCCLILVALCFCCDLGLVAF